MYESWEKTHRTGIMNTPGAAKGNMSFNMNHSSIHQRGKVLGVLHGQPANLLAFFIADSDGILIVVVEEIPIQENPLQFTTRVVNLSLYETRGCEAM